MDPQRAIFNANVDPWNTKHIGQETMNAISEAMQMARGKVVPANYGDSMPRSINYRYDDPNYSPRQNGHDNRYNDPDYTPSDRTKKIDLNINVSGFEDANKKVAEAGAELIAKAIPGLDPSNIDMNY